jgi:S1-C subfamily serine protease
MAKPLIYSLTNCLDSSASYSELNINIENQTVDFLSGGKGAFPGINSVLPINFSNSYEIRTKPILLSNVISQNGMSKYGILASRNTLVHLVIKNTKFKFYIKTLNSNDKKIKKAIKKSYGGPINTFVEFNCLSKKVFKFEENIIAKKETDKKLKDSSEIVAASSGTGFFVSTNGHMVTNNHVIDSCDNVQAHYKGKKVDTDVLFVDRANDLAIIKTNIKPKRVFAVSNEDVSLLEDIIVAGYPLGKNISSSIKTFKGSVTALAGYGDNYSNFQIDASLSSGNSGGPIINQKGNVVGVAVEKLVEVGVEGFNFGVKSSTLKTFASSNQFKFKPASTEELSNKELGQLITEATIYLECWMTVAKIKQIIQEGERQKAFFSEYK